MNDLKAIIRMFKLFDVINGLQKIDALPRFTVSEITGFEKKQNQEWKK